MDGVDLVLARDLNVDLSQPEGREYDENLAAMLAVEGI